MTRLCLLRHGPTAWNEAGRVQGRTDTALGEAGARAVRGWRPPAWTREASWRTSPLRRARATAALLGRPDAAPDPRLVEMDWGDFEGRRLAGLRERLGPALAALEALGLDFRPPGTLETPRAVLARTRGLLRELATEGGDAALVTHKGVIRAALALATGWALLGPPPLRLGPEDALLLELLPDGRVARPERAPLAAGG